jgi:LmbE family N-acetylglucosaminyl deacetylase
MDIKKTFRYVASGPLLLVGAHPDDAVLGAGGVAALMVRTGTPVFILTATDGELGGDPKTRLAEETASARLLGVAVEFGHLPDTRLELRAAIKVIDTAVRRLRPFTVLVHYPDDTHQDHSCLGRAVVSACRFVPNLLFYEGPSTRNFCPSMVIDVSRVWEQKRRALLTHQSQIARTSLLEWSDCVSRYRAWPRYAEARCEAFVPHHCDGSGITGLAFGGQCSEMSIAGVRVCDGRG